MGVDVKPLHLREAPRGVRPRGGRRAAAPFRRPAASTSSPPRSSCTTSTSRELGRLLARARAARPARAGGERPASARWSPILFGRAVLPVAVPLAVSVDDGLLSIRRGFREPELRAAFEAAGPRRASGSGARSPIACWRWRAAAAMSERRAEVVVVGRRPGRLRARAPAARGAGTTCCCSRPRFPRDKVCGESVSPEGWRLVRADLGAGTAVRALAPQPLRGMRLTAPDGTSFTGRYRGERRRASRCAALALDEALLARRARAGCRGGRGGARPRTCCSTRGSVAGVDGASGAAEPTRVRARLVVGADGRRSVVARRLGLLREHPRLRKFAVRGYWEAAEGLSDLGEMHVGERGYCGIAPLSATLANVAFVLDPRELARRRRRPRGLLPTHAAARWPGLAERLERGAPRRAAARDRPARRALPRGVPPRAPCCVGDAAGFYDPFTGEGVTLALRGAELAAAAAGEALGAGGAAPLPRLASYERARARRHPRQVPLQPPAPARGGLARGRQRRGPRACAGGPTWPTAWWASPATSCPRAGAPGARLPARAAHGLTALQALVRCAFGISPVTTLPPYGRPRPDTAALLGIYRTMLLSRRHRRQGDPAQAAEQDLLPDQRRRPRGGPGGRGHGAAARATTGSTPTTATAPCCLQLGMTPAEMLLGAVGAERRSRTRAAARCPRTGATSA